MSAGPPSEGLRRIAMLIAADLREGGRVLDDDPAGEPEEPVRRGRKATKVVAVAAHRTVSRAA